MELQEPDQHRFGGDWTERKLDALVRYFREYARIFNINSKAQYLETFYIDAFAGSGTRADRKEPNDDYALFQGELEIQKERLLSGSTRRILDVEPGLDNYIFVEKSKAKAAELKCLEKEFPKKAGKIQIQCCDANEFLVEWTRGMDDKQRALVFLDPYGMQVNWETIEAIASTRKIDLWFLFPIGMGIMRMLPKEGLPPDSWRNRLNLALGTDGWIDEFYEPDEQQLSFFSEEENFKMVADAEKIGRYVLDRLNSVFHAVAPHPAVLTNAKNFPMYLFCFAAGNERGAVPALKIANHLLKTFHGR